MIYLRAPTTRLPFLRSIKRTPSRPLHKDLHRPDLTVTQSLDPLCSRVCLSRRNMDAKLAARLERVRLLSQQDLATLPDKTRTTSPESPMDDKAAPGGGVALFPDATESTEIAPSPSADEVSKRTSSPDANMVTKEVPEPARPTNVQTENTERRFVLVQGVGSSYNLGSSLQLSPLPARPLPPAQLKTGELAATHEKFTPIVGLSKYPYKFCNKDCMQTIASAFFDQGKFWAREWDL